ncbi:hypothetical protein I6A84_29120, partial [Frankia sp. CNm7]|uniref:hypothetical protein n=1 Tax=Frankia nepalensis TaxID=1836974 RepID=UPI0019318DC8
MDLAPYVDTVREELAVAAEAGGEEARALADRLTATLESTIRLTLLEALSAAADEITRELAPGSVDVRLRGRDASFVVTSPSRPFDEPAERHGEATPAPAPASPSPAPAAEGDDAAIARINLRLPEHLKTRIEQAAGQASLSVNAWLVRAAAPARARGIREPRRAPPPR